VTFPEAALGTSIKVPTPDGTHVKLTIPAGTQTGKTFRIGGKGAPKLKGGGRGDLKVKVQLATPSALTDAQKTALETFSAETTEDVRAHIG
jgi:DnaJ-class molecular chaperone